MWDLLDRIFTTNLEIAGASLELQQRIFKYGVKEKNYQLLTKLADYQSLDKVIVDSFNSNNSVEVRKLWLLSTKIEKKNVLQLLKNEKRSSVLEASAYDTKVGAKVYSFLAESSSDTSLLFTLLNNEAVSEKLKVKILVKCLETPAKKNAGVNLTSFVNYLVYNDKSNLLNLILGEPKLLILSALIIEHHEISDLQLAKLDQVIKSELESIHLALGNDDFTLVALVSKLHPIEELLTKIDLSLVDVKGYRESTTALLKKCRSLKPSAKTSSLNVALDKFFNSLNNNKESGFKLIYNEIMKAKSQADLIVIFNKTTKLFNGVITNYRERDKIRMLLADHPQALDAFSYSMLQLVEGIYTPAELAVWLKKPESYGLMLSNIYGYSVKEALGYSSNPELCFEVLLQSVIDNDGYIPDSFFEEGLMDEKELLKLPVELISSSGYAKEVELTIMKIISSKVTSPASWEVFSSLSKGFEGTLGELINIATKI